MNEIELFLRFSFLGLSTLISIISVISFLKTKEIKIAFATIGFLLFTFEGLLVSIGIFSSTVEQFVTTNVLIGATFVSLIFFYLSILKR
ncbi:MAG TPA: hypothetical protein VN365_00205 [Candidatus Thermoplasmatota archaeon]|nr:hypothetical protein [Candidatus Thermoplasmatota archaeon]